MYKKMSVKWKLINGLPVTAVLLGLIALITDIQTVQALRVSGKRGKGRWHFGNGLRLLICAQCLKICMKIVNVNKEVALKDIM